MGEAVMKIGRKEYLTLKSENSALKTENAALKKQLEARNSNAEEVTKKQPEKSGKKGV
jgi:regulator of replication initiation timing